jgi:hypothetical protein
MNHDHGVAAVVGPYQYDLDDDIQIRLETQLRTLHQLDLWRAARKCHTALESCPAPARMLRNLLTPLEEEHILQCKYCREAISAISFFTLRRWVYRLREWLHHARPALLSWMRTITRRLAPVVFELMFLLAGVYAMYAHKWPLKRLDRVIDPATAAQEREVLKLLRSLEQELRSSKATQTASHVQVQQTGPQTQPHRTTEAKRGTSGVSSEPNRLLAGKRIDPQTEARLDILTEQERQLLLLPEADFESRKAKMLEFLSIYDDFLTKRTQFAASNTEGWRRMNVADFSADR